MRVERDGLIEDGLIVLLQIVVEAPAIVESSGILRVERNGLIEVSDGLMVLELGSEGAVFYDSKGRYRNRRPPIKETRHSTYYDSSINRVCSLRCRQKIAEAVTDGEVCVPDFHGKILKVAK